MSKLFPLLLLVTSSCGGPQGEFVSGQSRPGILSSSACGFVVGGCELTTQEAAKKFPASFYVTSAGKTCSATAIGPRAILTSAHCVRSAKKLSIAATGLTATCTPAAAYKADPSADYALCQLTDDLPGTFQPFETILVDKTPSVGQKVLLTGFGGILEIPLNNCAGGPCLTADVGEIFSLPTTNNYIVVKSKSVIWFGDSGGATFQVNAGDPSKRVQIGVNKKFTDSVVTVGQLKESNIAGLNTTTFKQFLAAWQGQTKLVVCTSEHSFKGCREGNLGS